MSLHRNGDRSQILVLSNSYKWGWLIIATATLLSTCFTLWGDSRWVTVEQDRRNEMNQAEALKNLDRRLLIIETQNVMILEELKIIRTKFDKNTNNH